MTFNEAIETAIARDARYGREAYVFLRKVLEFSMKRHHEAKKRRGGHVTAAEILECFRLQAIKEFGPMALTVFSYWGIYSSEDIGKMVFALVEAQFLTKTEEDTAEAFQAGFSFAEAFSQPFLARIKNE